MVLPQKPEPPPRLRTVRTLSASLHSATATQEVGQREYGHYVRTSWTVAARPPGVKLSASSKNLLPMGTWRSVVGCSDALTMRYEPRGGIPSVNIRIVLSAGRRV